MSKQKEVIDQNAAEPCRPPLQQGYYRVPGAPYVIRQASVTYSSKENSLEYAQKVTPKSRKKR